MRDPSGKYIPILHRMFYVATHSNDSMWLALVSLQFVGRPYDEL